MKKILFAGAFFLFALSARAQTAEDSVKAVVNRLFEAMRQADSSTLKTCFTDSALLQTIAMGPDRKPFVRTEFGAGQFAAQIGRLQKGVVDERIVFDMVKIDANLASVWTPYQFYYNGTLRHCGANSFQLVRLNGEWKIVHLIDTRRRDCKP